MDTLGTGLALIVNGLLQMGNQLVGWHTLMSISLLGSLMYLASNEVAELDRSSSKPNVERH
jgi:hypothetical protein